ncbi:MAG: hypothetical protein M3Y57_17525 [Acidobacteriota bacterium]|nr:hypothetical protein [Acidobacteriota bacterium]
MLIKTFTLLLVPILLCVFALPGNATLIGTSVDGSLTFTGDPSNYFDPGYGFVPATGYLNISGTTVTVSDSGVEFGFDDGASLISADFSGNHLIISDLIAMSGPANSFQMVFTDTAFAGQNLTLISDSYPLSGYAVSGDGMTLDYAGGNPTVGQTVTANFTVAPVPEPPTFGSLVISMLGVLAILFCRRPKSLKC